jgi:acyl-CoA reductase-like NAD-dependent aldehyde dehydrogenase
VDTSTTTVDYSPQLTRNQQILRKRAEEIKQVCCDETNRGELWADINTTNSIGLIEEYASLTRSIATRSIPFVQSGYGLVLKEHGVVLGIAPWNAPVILGLRAVVAPIVADNVAILKARLSLPSLVQFPAAAARSY